MIEYGNEFEIVFGGDFFDQFAPDFDTHSSKSVAIWQNIGMSESGGDQIIMIIFLIFLIFLILTEYTNDLEMVFGGDGLDKFAYDFDDHSSKSVAIDRI